MSNNLLNISSIDGRYTNLTKELNNYFSEYGFFKYRVKMEVLYFLFLNKTINFVKLDKEKENEIYSIIDKFNMVECEKIKEFENKINHDVKAVEYYLIMKLRALELSKFTQFIHFGLTSQDINNTSITLMIKDSISNVIIPELNKVMKEIYNKVENWIKIIMMSRTHGQSATPTTLGKEFQVFHYRLKKQLDILQSITYYGKFGGAVGNLNAHYISYPNIDWEDNLSYFLEDIGLKREVLTTQIDNYENLAVIFDCLRRINCILIDMSRDIWHYISIDYLSQNYNNNEVGSSTMPHKINPINFENSEGNLQLANSMLDFMSNKLPISRLQRDLTDSTVLRNVGSIFGHILIGYKNMVKGLLKLDANKSKIELDLNDNLCILMEAIQIILKKYGYNNSYEVVKNFSRGNKDLTRTELNFFIKHLDINDNVKKELLSINYENYIGNSNKIKKY